MNAGFHTRWWLGALAIGIVALAALGLVAGRAPGQTAVKLSPPPSADASPSSTPGLVAIASPTTDLDQYLVTPPPPTTPPARTIEVAGVEFDLPGGWYDPPDFNTLALIAAVNSLHDPPAGVYMALIHGERIQPGFGYLFRDSHMALYRGVIADASTPNVEAGKLMQAAGRLGSRRTLSLPIGRAAQVDWDIPPDADGFNALHVRDVLLPAGRSVVEIRLITTGAPDKAAAAEFLRILRSIRPAPGPSPSP